MRLFGRIFGRKGLETAGNITEKVMGGAVKIREARKGNVEKNAQRAYELEAKLMDYRKKNSSSKMFEMTARPFIYLLWIWFASPLLKWLPGLTEILSDYNTLVNTIGGGALVKNSVAEDGEQKGS